MRSIKETFRALGIELESKYLVYTTKDRDRTIAVPYHHIKSIELKENRVLVSTGGLERITLELPSEGMAKQLFEELLLQLEKVYL
ncbi:MAG: hypothetical protein NZ827_01545 [Aquificaceae bacterium]|nr:hypothetical protein [Aquificaceae bacterium]MDW8294907.1 hypothetical protein [Aquificaceae bacterium]